MFHIKVRHSPTSFQSVNGLVAWSDLSPASCTPVFHQANSPRARSRWLSICFLASSDISKVLFCQPSLNISAATDLAMIRSRRQSMGMLTDYERAPLLPPRVGGNQRLKSTHDKRLGILTRTKTRVLNCKYNITVRYILDIHLVSNTSRRKCIYAQRH